MMEEDDRFEMQWMCAYCKCYYVSKQIFKEHKKTKHGKNSKFGYWKKLRKKSKKKKLMQTISTVINKIHSDTDDDDDDDDSNVNFQEDNRKPQEDKGKKTAGQRKDKDKDLVQKEKEKIDIPVIDLIDSDDESDSDEEPPPILTKMFESKKDHSIPKLTENKDKWQEKRRDQQTPLNVNNNNVQPQEAQAKKCVTGLTIESSSNKEKNLQMTSKSGSEIEMKNSADSTNASNIKPRKNAVDIFLQKKKKNDTSNYEELKNSSNNSLSSSSISISAQKLLHVQQNLQSHQAQAKNSDKNYSDDSGYIDYCENVITKKGERHLKLRKSRSSSNNDKGPFDFEDDDNDNNILKGSQDIISSSTKNNIISPYSNTNIKKNLRKSLKDEDHKCQICSKVFKSSRWLGNHLSRAHMNLMRKNPNNGINCTSSSNNNSHTSIDCNDNDVQILKIHPPTIMPSTSRTNSNMMIFQDQLPNQYSLNKCGNTSNSALIISNTQDKSNFQSQLQSTSTSVIVKINHKPKPKSYFQYQYEKHDHSNYALLHYEQVLKNTKRRQLRQAKKERMSFKILKRIFIENSVRVDEDEIVINKISTNSVDLIIEEVIQSVSKRSLSLNDHYKSFKRQKRF